MEPNELRIGNYIHNIEYKRDVKFTSFFGLCNFETSTDNYKPIPITEEWLLKLGFEDWGTVGQRYVLYNVIDGTSNFEIHVFDNDYEPYIDSDEMIYIHDLRFVHQLQNLYFALTGKELTINEQPKT